MVGASTTCKHNETAVHWALSSGGIVVKDALGRLVGRFLVTGGAEAALMANGKVALLVGSAGFVLNPTWIVYQAPNCTGTGYMYSQIATELRLTETAWFDGQEFRYPSPSGPFVSFTGVSYLDGGFNCVNGDPGLSPDVKYAALQVVSLSSLNFVAPFHLE